MGAPVRAQKRGSASSVPMNIVPYTPSRPTGPRSAPSSRRPIPKRTERSYSSNSSGDEVTGGRANVYRKYNYSDSDISV